MFIQNFMDNFIIYSALYPASDMKNVNLNTLNRNVYTQPFPTPAYTYDVFVKSVADFIGLIFALVYIWPVTR